MTVIKLEMLVKAKTVSIYEKALRRLKWMSDWTGLPAPDLLAEAMRDALAECKTQAGLDRILAWHEKYKDAKDSTGSRASAVVDWNDAEIEMLKAFRTEKGFTEISFVSYAAIKYVKEWGPRMVEIRVSNTAMPPPPPDIE